MFALIDGALETQRYGQMGFQCADRLQEMIGRRFYDESINATFQSWNNIVMILVTGVEQAIFYFYYMPTCIFISGLSDQTFRSTLHLLDI